jgi:hypothetical protein
LQRTLVGRIARAAWRLERAERLEVDLFAERLLAVPDGGPGLALIRDGNGTRSFDTLLRYRGAAMAELMRALRMLKALQAEAPAPVEPAVGPGRAPDAHAGSAAAPAAIARPGPNEPERPSISEYVASDRSSPAALSANARRAGRRTNLSLVGIGTKAWAPCPPRASAPPSRPNEPENPQESTAEPESASCRRDHSNPAPRRTRRVMDEALRR